MNALNDAASLLFLDFEASGLSANSWPIEIGCSRLVNGETLTTSSLIRPDPAWDLAEWSPASQKVHGIALNALQSAPPAEEVARVFYPDLTRFPVFSDQPAFEARWLARLLATAGLAPVSVQPFTQAAEWLLSDRQQDFFHERLSRLRAPHRAGPDSARFTEALRYALMI